VGNSYLIKVRISAETSVTEEPREGKLHAKICAGVPSDRHSYRVCVKRRLSSMSEIVNHEVAGVFNSYPKEMRKKILFLRQLVLNVASEIEGMGELEETIKWGDPSYLANKGSTIRIGWKKSKPDQYAMYFHCKTTLVDTFKELYRDKFKFEGNRAIVFGVDDQIPIEELKHCIELSLTYHSRKQLPILEA